MPDDVKNASAAKNSDASPTSVRNITNNTQTLGMSQYSLDKFQQSVSSVFGSVAQNPTSCSDLCSTDFGAVSCQVSDSSQLSNTSSTVSKVNVTNNAYLMSLSKQSFQQSRQSMISQLSQHGVTDSKPQLASFTMFPAEPDTVISQLAVTVATPQPVFFSPIAVPSINDDNEIRRATEPAKMPNIRDKAKDVSETITFSQKLKPAEVTSEISRDRKDGAAYATNVTESAKMPNMSDKAQDLPETIKLSQRLKPDEAKTEMPRDGQDGAEYSTNFSGKSAQERPRPQSPPSSKQIERNPTVEVTQDAAPSVSETAKQSGVAAKANAVEITLPLDAFTLHETVKQLLNTDKEINAFTLHNTIKRLMGNETQTTAAQASKQKRKTTTTASVETSSAPTQKDYANSGFSKSSTIQDKESTKTGFSQPSASQDKEAAKTGFPQSSESQNKKAMKTEVSAVSENVPSHTEEKRQAIRITVQPPEQSKNQENGDDWKPKKKMLRFEIVEDLPSPINPVDQQLPSPSPSTHSQPELQQPDEQSLTSADDLLAPSPLPSDELMELDSEAMMSLKRLFPTIGSLVKVTLVLPRRKSKERAEQGVTEGRTDVLLTSGLSDDGEAESAEYSPSDDEELESVDETEEELEKSGKASLKSLDRNTLVIEKSREGPAHDQSSREGPAHDQTSAGSSLPRTFKQIPPHDVVSVDVSTMSSSTELGLDAVPSSRQISDVQVILVNFIRNL